MPWVETGWGYAGHAEADPAAAVVLGQDEAPTKSAPARAHVEAFQSARETVYPWPLSGQQAADPADVDAFAQLAPDRVPDDRAPAER
jgi:hypothetical protein